MRTLLCLSLIGACTKDPDKLLGDSNVYAEPLEIEDFQMIENDSETGLDIETLGAELHDGTILITHQTEGPCDNSWDNISVDSSEDFLIQIDYGFSELSSQECTFNLAYEIGISGSGLKPGLYKIKIMEDSTEIDLSEALGD